MGFLTPNLWFDDADAPQRLAQMEKTQQISAGEAQWISHFRQYGFGILEVNGVDKLADQLLLDVEDLWRQAPFDISISGPEHDRPMPMQEGAPIMQRGPGVRIMDMHSFSQAALQLYLLPELHHICNLLFGARRCFFNMAAHRVCIATPGM